MEYPESVLTKDRKGNLQVRWLVDKGRFSRYEYRDPRSKRLLEKGKRSLILNGREHWYMIPIGKGRMLAILQKAGKERKLWDGKKAVSP